MKNPILEKRIVPVAQPTDNQKSVLAKIVAASTPRIAAAEISETANLSAARDMLEKLGLIELNDEGAFVTDAGNEVMLKQNLVTSTGELTNDGQIAAHGEAAAAQAPDPEDDFDFDLGGDDELDAELGNELELGDENKEKGEGGVGLELDVGENFSLINNIRDKALTESFENVPQEVLQNLTAEEKVILRRIIDGGDELYRHRELYSKLFDYFVDKMPYGTAKGRTGDPDQWIEDRIRGDIGDQDLGSMADWAEYSMTDR